MLLPLSCNKDKKNIRKMQLMI